MASSDRFRHAAVEPPDRSVLRVRDPGELVAAVPVLLGFHPRDSLVLVATGGSSGRRLGLTVRVDLPPPEAVRIDAEAVGDAAVQGLLLDAPTGAVVIVVGGDSGADPPCRELTDLVTRLLEGHGVDVQTVLWAESTAAGARWACLEPCGCTGTLPDPSSTPLAAAAVAGGQVVHADRAELARMVAPADAERVQRRETLLVRAVDEMLSCTDAAADDPEAGRVEDTVVIDSAIADAGAGRLVLDDDRVLALAGALAVPAVRDAALLRCAGPEAAAAEQLWTALVRETPDPEAAEPAALLAVSALLRGDGALANVALDRAEQAWPGHRLTGLLCSAVATGMRPGEIRECLQRGLVTGSLPGQQRRITRRCSG